MTDDDRANALLLVVRRARDLRDVSGQLAQLDPVAAEAWRKLDEAIRALDDLLVAHARQAIGEEHARRRRT